MSTSCPLAATDPAVWRELLVYAAQHAALDTFLWRQAHVVEQGNLSMQSSMSGVTAPTACKNFTLIQRTHSQLPHISPTRSVANVLHSAQWYSGLLCQ